MNPIVGVSWNLVDMMLLVMIITFYLYFNVKLLIRMYKGHRLEFSDHASRHIANVATTSVCILIFLYQDFIWLLNYACKIGKTKEQFDNSYCHEIQFYTLNPSIGTQTLLGIFLFDITRLIPFWAFLIFNKPHDCFACLGKDPSRSYSRFQYSKQELLKLKMATKFGKVKANMLTNNDLASKHLSTKLGLRKQSEENDNILLFTNENRINPTDETIRGTFIDSTYVRGTSHQLLVDY